MRRRHRFSQTGPIAATPNPMGRDHALGASSETERCDCGAMWRLRLRVKVACSNYVKLRYSGDSTSIGGEKEKEKGLGLVGLQLRLRSPEPEGGGRGSDPLLPGREPGHRGYECLEHLSGGYTKKANPPGAPGTDGFQGQETRDQGPPCITAVNPPITVTNPYPPIYSNLNLVELAKHERDGEVSPFLRRLPRASRTRAPARISVSSWNHIVSSSHLFGLAMQSDMVWAFGT